MTTRFAYSVLCFQRFTHGCLPIVYVVRAPKEPNAAPATFMESHKEADNKFAHGLWRRKNCTGAFVCTGTVNCLPTVVGGVRIGDQAEPAARLVVASST